MEEVGVESLFLEELGDFLSVFAGGAVDDGSARLLAGEVGSDYVVYIGEFLLGVGLDHDKFQVGAVGASVQAGQFNQEFLAEVLDYFSFYLRLGGGGQAEYRRRWAVARGLLDELADVAVIGPEVVAPF